jgi:hypothetical protein
MVEQPLSPRKGLYGDLHTANPAEHARRSRARDDQAFVRQEDLPCLTMRHNRALAATDAGGPRADARRDARQAPALTDIYPDLRAGR